jgi:acyl-CoA thioester hydrolase
MLYNETKIRVRYGETDRMGYLYHGTYPLYFETGRTELLRQLGLTYKQMEDDGIMLPLNKLSIQYFLPAYYDDELVVKTYMKKLPSVRLEFEYEILNQKNELLCKASTTLVFISAIKRKPIRLPDYFYQLIQPYFKS